MIQKYFSIAIILIGILVVSCRQDNETSNQNEENSFLKKGAFKKDSTQNSDLPNDGDVVQKSDSTYVGIDPNDPPPPKNGTHYKSK